MRVSLDWLKDFIEVKGGLENIKDTLTMIGLEVISISDIEDDHLMDIEVTPNRPDCLSIIGVARELSAAINKSLKIPLSVQKHYMKKDSGKGSVKIEVLDKKGCPRYVGATLKSAQVNASPEWLIKRLNALGVRSVNNIVDITNYVLFETGQPLHAFDMDKIEGKKIIVRKAKKGETIVTIDGIKRELDPSILVIADVKKPIAIAGIMGGKETEISNGTKNILLESAYFDPVIIRGAQRKLALASESSYRFERGVDIGMVLSASARAQELMKDIAGCRVSGTVSDIGGSSIKEKEIMFSPDETGRILGIEIDLQKTQAFFKRLGFKTAKRSKNQISVKIPSYRQDLERDVDLIEELARLYGYDNIPLKIPVFKIQKTYEEEKKEAVCLEKELKTILFRLGINEIVTYSLTSRFAIEILGKSVADAAQLKNPLSSNHEFMRTSLIPEMLEAISWNLNRKNTPLMLFELNKVYLKNKDTDKIEEKTNLAIGVCGVTSTNWKEKRRAIDFFDLKGIVEVFLRALGVKDFVIEKKDSFIFKNSLSSHIKIDKDVIGTFGELKSDIAKRFDIKEKIYLLEMDTDDLLKYIDLKKRFIPLSRYPSIKRDISLVMDDSLRAEDIFNLMKEVAKDMLKSIDVFDLYKGRQIEEGKKSLAYTLEYRSDERTLKDEDISEIHKKIQDALVKKLGCQIR